MAVLTWRNVDAPNFTGATDGLRTASQLLGNAVQAGQNVISGFTQANSDFADRDILNRALAYQDPAAYQAALASGAIVGGNAGNASLATLRGLDTRSGVLLDQATARQGLEKGVVGIKQANQTFDQNAYLNSRMQAGNALTDAASPDIAQARLLARNNDQVGLNKLLGSSAALKALRPEQLSELLTGVDTLASNNQNRRTVDTNFTQGSWRFGREQQNAADEDAAAKALKDVVRGSVSQGDATRIIDGKADGLSPGAFTRLISGARGVGYNTFAPAIDGNSSGIDVMTGGAKLPSGIKTVGDMVNGKSSLLGSNPKGTATGMFQVTSDTWKQFAPGALGKDWESADIRDPKVQDDVAKAVWESVKDSPQGIAGRWASISPAEAQMMKGSSWDAVRDTISQKESGTTASSLISKKASNNFGAVVTQQMLSERAGQNQATGIAPELNQLQADRRSANDIAGSLVGKDGPLSGSNKGAVLNYVNYLVNSSGGRMNAAMAGQLLARNTKGAESKAERAASIIAGMVSPITGQQIRTPNLGNGIRLDDDAIYRAQAEYLNGTTSNQVLAQGSLGVVNQVVQSAQERYNDADAEYRAVRSQARNRSGLTETLQRYKERRDEAEQALREATQSVVNNDTLTPRYDRPVAKSQGR